MLLSIKIEFRAKSLEFIHRCADISESLAPSAHLCINSKLLALRLLLMIKYDVPACILPLHSVHSIASF